MYFILLIPLPFLPIALIPVCAVVFKRPLTVLLLALLLGKLGFAHRFFPIRGGDALRKPLGFRALVPSLALRTVLFPVLPCVVAFDQCAYLVAIMVDVLALANADGIFQRVATVKADVSPPNCGDVVVGKFAALKATSGDYLPNEDVSLLQEIVRVKNQPSGYDTSALHQG